MKVYARERYFVRADKLGPSLCKKIIDHYTTHFFEEKACAKCEWNSLRAQYGLPGECEACAAYKYSTKLANKVLVGKHKYIACPLGDYQGLCKLIRSKGDIQLVEKHPIIPIKPIHITSELRPYQKEAVKACIKGQKGVLEAPPRSGKCVVGSTMVMTKHGILPIKELFPSIKSEYTSADLHTIATRFGKKQVFGTYAKIVDSTIRIVDSNGYVIEGTPNHRILIQDRELRRKWVMLQDLKVDDVIIHSRREQWLNKQTPDIISNVRPSAHQKNIGLPNKLSIELAELLGFWVANGSLNVKGTLNISTYNEVIQDRIIYCLNSVFDGLNYRKEKDGVYIASEYVRNFLRYSNIGLSFGLAKDKCVPDILLRADKKYMDAFLRAYISCDGWLYESGIGLSSASSKLIYQLQVILSYYGCRSKRTRKLCYARNGKRIKRPYYFLDIRSDAYKLSYLNFYKDWEYTAGKNQTDTIYYGHEVLNNLHHKYIVYGKMNKRYYKIGKSVIPLNDDIILHKQLKRRARFEQPDMQVMSAHRLNLNTLKLMDKAYYERFKKALNNDYFYTKVTDISVINKPRVVYDLCVPDCHEYVANSIVSHNTVMLTAIIAKLSVKSLIIASQRDWLVGFYETFVGSETQKGFTDLDKSRIGFCKKLEDFERFDVCLATVQTFHSENGQKLLRKLRDKFTLVGIDEVHTSSANRYIQEISRFNCKYKIGLTGTPDRKDGKYPLTEKVVGPIIYQANVERLRPTIRLVRTKYNRVMKSGVWSYIVRNMENDKDRQKLIAQYAIQDMKNGHMVLIPFTQVKPILSMVKLINDMYGSQVAYPFYGGLRKDVRDKTIEDARKYKVKIIVGNMRLLGTGINIPRASALFECTPSANPPQCIQRTSRILTPCDDKPQPIIRYFLDDTQVRRACLHKEFWLVLREFKAIISEKDMETMKAYLNDKPRKFSVNL